MNPVRVGMLITAAALAYASPRQGNMDEITSAREAVRQASAEFGEDHPVTAFMLRNLGLAMQEAGYSNYAERYAGQALAILERHFGSADVSLAPALNVMAEAAFSQGHYAQARELAVRAVAIGPAAGAHYGTALHNLAAVCQAEGKFQEATEWYRQALAAREKALPPGHPYITLTRDALRRAERSAKLVARR